MLKKFIFSGIIALFLLSLLPITASANTSALQPGTLIKGANASVYYYGADGKRYVFPTENTYKTWFLSFNTVVAISNDLLGTLPIGGNVTYKPGVKLVKITTDPKVYYVDKEGTLRWVTSESLAQNLWGLTWNKMIDDVPDPFFVNYKVGTPLENPDITSIPATYSINQDKLISDQPDPISSEISNITLTGSVSGTTANLNWTTTNVTADQGFKIVWSSQSDPVYPGNEYHYLSDPNVRSDSWTNLAGGTYYFRACQYLGSSCGIYSNNLKLVIGSDPDALLKKISLFGYYDENNEVILTWQSNFSIYNGIKIVKSTSLNPVYPGNDFHYLSGQFLLTKYSQDPPGSTDIWKNLAPGTYHFRACEYLNGSCGIYSNDLSITIAGATATSSKSISASYIISGTDAKISWTTNFNSASGFKIVKADHVNPVYPGDDYHYLTSPSSTSDLWQNLPAGTWHFRVCEYLGGSCGAYSNDLTVIIPLIDNSPAFHDNTNGSISLSGNVNSGRVYLNWVLNTMTSELGFKVVKAEHINPVYPGDTYHYYTDQSLRTDTWESLSAGTYHFRVCEYLGGSCGIYSNDLVLTVQ